MISTRTRPLRKASLRRWWISLPLLLPPFMVLFSEAWLHTQILRNQYEVNSVTQSTRALQGRIDALLEDRHRLVRMERIYAKAPDLGLVEPNPGQIEEIFATPQPEPSGGQSAIVIAKRTDDNAAEDKGPQPPGQKNASFQSD